MKLTKEQVEQKKATIKEWVIGVTKAEMDIESLELQKRHAKIKTEKNLYVTELEVAIGQVNAHIELTKNNIEVLKKQLK